MKRTIIHSVAAISGFVCLVSCTEQESLLQSVNPSSTHQLHIVTRNGEGSEATTPAASVYLFNSSGAFVRTLETSATSYTSASGSVKLSEGTYTLCAIGPSDLSCFDIPASPTPTTAITLASGQTMGDLLMANANATLDDGDNETVNMSLERKVLEISSVTISQVPTEVTAVTVSIASFCSGIQFNGTYVETSPVTATFTLSQTATAGTWQTTDPQLVFPSIGNPTITVTFARGTEDSRTYAYETESALTANNKYDISGTYTEPLGVTLSGSLSLQSWPSTSTDVAFEFDENTPSGNTSGNDPGTGGDDPTPGTAPEQGGTYKGCFVVSVDETNHKAVLLSPTEEPCSTGGDDPRDWMAFINTKLDSWTSVSGVSGTWRLPTITEVNAFAFDSDFLEGVSIDTQKWKALFFSSETTLKAVKYTAKADGTFKTEVKVDNNDFNQTFFIRPVIDITF